jgi:hypothetical protein
LIYIGLFFRTCAPTIFSRPRVRVRGARCGRLLLTRVAIEARVGAAFLVRVPLCVLCVGVGVRCVWVWVCIVSRCAGVLFSFVHIFSPLLTSKSTTHIFFMPHLQPRIQTHLIHPIMHPVAKDGMMTLSSSSANKHPTPLYIVTF